MKRKPMVGDERYRVEWCESIPIDENGDGDLDAAVYRRRLFATHTAAIAFAKSVLPRDAFGAVDVTPIRFVAYDDDDAIIYPHVGFWEDVGDGETIDE